MNTKDIRRIHICIIILLLLILLSLIVILKDYTVILEMLNYLNQRAALKFNIDMGVVPNYIHSTVSETFVSLGYNFLDRLEAIVGDIKDPHNKDIRDLLVLTWNVLIFSFLQLPYTVEYTRHFFFIYNYIYLPVNLYYIYVLIKLLITLIVIAIIMLIYYPKDKDKK
jgi:hypothetical protein